MDKTSSDGKGAFVIFGVVLGVAGMWYFSDEPIRYPIEQEYSFISTCVGKYGTETRKNVCIDFLKKCHKKEKKDIKACIDYINF